MEICVAGWFYPNYFYEKLIRVRGKYPVTVMTPVTDRHRPPNFVLKHFNYFLRQNIGLEFGAYHDFLINCWQGEDVLFLHDDTYITNTKVFDKIASLSSHGIDSAYIFRDEAEEKSNGRMHGRAIFCSRSTLDLLAFCGGIGYDRENNGYNGSRDGAVFPRPSNTLDFNYGIYCWNNTLNNLRRFNNLNTNVKVRMPWLINGHRGKFNHVWRQRQKYFYIDTRTIGHPIYKCVSSV